MATSTKKKKKSSKGAAAEPAAAAAVPMEVEGQASAVEVEPHVSPIASPLAVSGRRRGGAPQRGLSERQGARGC
jgi:hypothetical protein